MLRLVMVNSDNKDAPALPAAEGVDVVLQDLRVRAFARTPYDHLVVEIGHVDAAERALQEGCDALFIDTFADYAIERIRTVADVPVIGAGEAGIAEAAQSGRRFSIVTVWPTSMGWLYDERLHHCAGGQRCGGVHHIGAEEELDLLGTATGVQARMSRAEQSTLDTIVEACHQAIQADGTEAVLLGCTCMSPVAEAIQARCDFPVIDASAAGLRAAYAALDSGDGPASTQPTRRAGTIPTLVDAWLAAGDLPAIDECDVCAITPS